MRSLCIRHWGVACRRRAGETRSRGPGYARPRPGWTELCGDWWALAKSSHPKQPRERLPRTEPPSLLGIGPASCTRCPAPLPKHRSGQTRRLPGPPGPPGGSYPLGDASVSDCHITRSYIPPWGRAGRRRQCVSRTERAGRSRRSNSSAPPSEAASTARLCGDLSSPGPPRALAAAPYSSSRSGQTADVAGSEQFASCVAALPGFSGGPFGGIFRTPGVTGCIPDRVGPALGARGGGGREGDQGWAGKVENGSKRRAGTAGLWTRTSGMEKRQKGGKIWKWIALGGGGWGNPRAQTWGRQEQT